MLTVSTCATILPCCKSKGFMDKLSISTIIILLNTCEMLFGKILSVSDCTGIISTISPSLRARPVTFTRTAV